jgi:chemotaxis protein methyltransferase CheR
MNIYFEKVFLSDKSFYWEVNILGPHGENEDTIELCKLLLSSDATAVTISCFDADSLPTELIDAIGKAIDRGIKIKLYAYRPLLVFSLSRLSLPVLTINLEPPKVILLECKAVALAGSANSLDKIINIIEKIPNSNTTIYIVQHILEDQPNLLERLLKVKANYSIVMPTNNMEVKPHTIYIAPPAYHMKVFNKQIILNQEEKINYARPSIDVLFESLATEYGSELLVALLCGYGNDGVAGCASIRANGGCVLIENGQECNGASILPDNVFKAGHYDHQLKQRGIISIISIALVPRNTTVNDIFLDLFLDAFFELTGYDFRSFQQNTIKRRLNNLIIQSGHASFFDFQRQALSNPQITERLLTEFSINVTEFFRHPQQFLLLREKIFPYLASFPTIKIWSAGCATGEEAYSVAILLEELGLLEKSQIFATDINSHLLDLAKEGLYPNEALPLSQKNYAIACGKNPNDLSHYLESCGHYLKMLEKYRKKIYFHHHALGQDGAFNEFQLIICHNVMIYFDQNLQRRVFELFSNSLHREGFLMLGPNDGLKTLATESNFVPDSFGQHVYRITKDHPEVINE